MKRYDYTPGQCERAERAETLLREYRVHFSAPSDSVYARAAVENIDAVLAAAASGCAPANATLVAQVAELTRERDEARAEGARLRNDASALYRREADKRQTAEEINQTTANALSRVEDEVTRLTEALEAERAENADHLKVNRELASDLIAAEAQVRDFKVRHAAASSILAGAGTFLDSAALEALQGPAPAASPSSRPRAALRRLRAMLLERGEAELIRLVDLALKDGAG